MMLDGRILRGLFEHERLNPANIRTSQGNIQKAINILFKNYQYKVEIIAINTLNDRD